VPEWTNGAVSKTAHQGVEVLISPPRVATGIDWAFAPEWLTLEEAGFLTGHDRVYLLAVADGGGVDLDSEGRIEKLSLWEWQETVALVAHWADHTEGAMDNQEAPLTDF
jgi:hypothetical protein